MTEPLFQYSTVLDELRRRGVSDWVEVLQGCAADALSSDRNGDRSRWVNAIQQLPTDPETRVSICDGVVSFVCDDQSPSPDSIVNADFLRQQLMQLHPWRKGPFRFHGLKIDTEWRSDWKWDRLAPHVDFRERLVLDVGCGNGYFGWRMLNAGASWVCGLDPFLLYVMQSEVARWMVSQSNDAKSRQWYDRNVVLPVGDDVLGTELRCFDTVLSMGVLYHQRDPLQHLRSLLLALRRGGTLVLETLVIEGSVTEVLVPEDRYAQMRNVWFIPSVALLERWLKRIGFRDCRVIDVSRTTTEEQRSTEWMTFDSLPQFLDPLDSQRTIEGYPGPLRAMILATAN